jgi:hypothetical protein
VPIVVSGLAGVSLFAPVWVVDYVAPPVLLAALLFLLLSGLLFRPPDRRAWRRILNAERRAATRS